MYSSQLPNLGGVHFIRIRGSGTLHYFQKVTRLGVADSKTRMLAAPASFLMAQDSAVAGVGGEGIELIFDNQAVWPNLSRVRGYGPLSTMVLSLSLSSQVLSSVPIPLSALCSIISTQDHHLLSVP